MTDLTQLGQIVSAANSPDEAVLETIAFSTSMEEDEHLAVRLTCPEFTSLCPKTNQPDFAIIVVDYVPHSKLIESKSFKLFMQSFRNHGAFHERVAQEIGRRLEDAIEPVWLRVSAYFYPRGGIPIDVFWQTSSMPKHVYVPDANIPTFRGR